MKEFFLSNSEIIHILTEFKSEYAKQYGILRLGVFGSVARDEAHTESDVDVVVETSTQNLFNLIGIKQTLEDKLQQQVDVVSYREKMNRF